MPRPPRRCGPSKINEGWAGLGPRYNEQVESNPPLNPNSPGGPKPFGLAWSNVWLYPLLACFLLAALFNLRLINDADMGFHLKTGQWILENHQVPSNDTFTYTSTERRYLDMEWLYQLSLYLGYLLGGYSLLSILHGILALLAFYLLWVRLKGTGAPTGLAVGLLTIALFACESRFRVRPEILTWVLMGLTLWILESRWSRGRDLLFLLPLIQWFWVNTEGLFFIGWALMGAYVLSSFVHSPKVDFKLVKYCGAAFAVCLLNPYFFQGLLFPFSFLSSLGSSEIYGYAVNEFQRPWSYRLPSHGSAPLYLQFYKAFSLFLIAGLFSAFKSRKTHEWLLALFFFALSASAVRNIPLFLLACAPLAASGWSERLRPWLQRAKFPPLSRSLAAFGLTLFLLGFSARVVTNAHYVSGRLTDRFGLGLDPEAQPEGACEFLVHNHLDGRILNDLDNGDWLDWRGPQKTFIDGRLDVMGSDLFTRYSRSQLPGGAAALAAQVRPDIFFFDPIQIPQWAMDLRQMPDWRLVYVDPRVVVYLRKGYAEQVPALDEKKWLTDKGLSSNLQARASEWLRLEPPSAWRLWAEGFVREANYPNDRMDWGIFWGYSGNLSASEACFLDGIARTNGRYEDFYYNLGLLYEYEGRHPEAVLCMNRALRDRPEDPMARQILGLPPQP